jgi:hypothetical protein
VENSTLRWLSAVTASLVLAACAPTPGGLSDPIRRKAQWHATAGGDDLRAGCAMGRPSRWRLVYNASWDEQVRVYDIERLPAGEGARLVSTAVQGAPRVLQAYLMQLGGQPTTRVAESRLPEPQLAALLRAIDEAGFARRPEEGMRLVSWDFYWLASACVDGTWHLNAWRRGDPGFQRLGFDELLFALDQTGVEPNRPRAIDPARRALEAGEPAGGGRGSRDESFEFLVRDGRIWRPGFGN